MASFEFRYLRKVTGWTQGEAAELMGMSQPAFSAIESGEREPTKIQIAFATVLTVAFEQEQSANRVHCPLLIMDSMRHRVRSAIKISEAE